MHARKFTARVRAASKGGPSLLRIEMNAGHGGADQVAKSIVSSVDQVAFLFGQFGLKPPEKKVEVDPAAAAPAAAPAPAPAAAPAAAPAGKSTEAP
jgi:hypothetical protein